MNFSDPFEDEAESIIASAEEAGHVIPADKRDALRYEMTELLSAAWNECMARAREVAEQNRQSPPQRH